MEAPEVSPGPTYEKGREALGGMADYDEIVEKRMAHYMGEFGGDREKAAAALADWQRKIIKEFLGPQALAELRTREEQEEKELSEKVHRFQAETGPEPPTIH